MQIFRTERRHSYIRGIAKLSHVLNFKMKGLASYVRRINGIHVSVVKIFQAVFLARHRGDLNDAAQAEHGHNAVKKHLVGTFRCAEKMISGVFLSEVHASVGQIRALINGNDVQIGAGVKGDPDKGGV